VDEARAMGTDITTVHVVHIELKWTSCEWIRNKERGREEK